LEKKLLDATNGVLGVKERRRALELEIFWQTMRRKKSRETETDWKEN
jgi:hypothetical protein